MGGASVIAAGFHICTAVQRSLKCLSRSRRRLLRRSPRESTQKQTTNRRGRRRETETEKKKKKQSRANGGVKWGYKRCIINSLHPSSSIPLFRLELWLPVSLLWVLMPVSLQKAKWNKWHRLIFTLRHKSVRHFYEPVLCFISVLYWHQAQLQQMPVIYSLLTTSVLMH